MRSFIVYCLSFIVVLSALLPAANCYAVTWSSTELIEKAKELNGRKLNYKGELITAILNKGDYSWMNLNDGFNAIGIWCKNSSLDKVKFAGDYKNRGDIIEVSGTFNRACPIHNGELDIHAEAIKIISQGHSVKRGINTSRVQSTVALFTLLLFAVVIFRKRL